MKPTPAHPKTPLRRLFYRLLWLRLFVPLLFGALIVMAVVLHLAARAYINQQETLNSSVVYSVSRYIDDTANLLDSLAMRAAVSDAPEMALAMEVAQKGYEFCDAFYLLDADGRVLAISPRDDRYLGLDFSRQDYFQQALETSGVIISRPFLSLRSGQPAVTLARRTLLKGVMAGELGLAELQRIITQSTHADMPSETFIVDQSGTLLAHPRIHLVAQQINVGQMEVIRQAQGSSGASLLYWYDGRLYLGSATKVSASGWVVVSQALASAVLKPYSLPALAFCLIASGVLGLFMRLFGNEFQRAVSKPLARLSQATSAVTDGNYPARAEVSSSPHSFEELSTLTENFIQMYRAVLERENQLEHLANHDSLTNLANRVLLQKHLEEQIHASRCAGCDFAVLFIDLDNFKTVNDAFGHSTGDLVLQQIAGLLDECCEENDFISRLGGDEFAVIINRERITQSASAAAERILQQLNQPMQLQEQEIYISCSIGISVFPLDGNTVDTLLQNADTAMYQSKQGGKNTYQFYTLELETSAQERHRMTAALHHAMEQDEFEMIYQPIYSASNCQIAGSEALIRWHNPRLGSVPPTRFIPLANETGLMLPLGEWILHTSCRENQRLAQAGLHRPWMSVNLTERQLRHEGFLDSVQRALDETGLPPELLVLELTENIFFQGYTEIDALLVKVKRLGVLLALDDFGTGYSTLSCLTKIPFDMIKIDRSLSQHITTSPREAALVRGILQVAHDLGMQVVAEGIETEEQLRFYESLNCDLLQGYYFNKPMKKAAFRALFAQAPEAS